MKHANRIGLLGSSTAFATATLVAASTCWAATDLPVLSLPESRVFPESITSTADGSLILGSLNGGIIYRIAPGKTVAEPWITPAVAGRSVYGVHADEPRGILWACSVLRDGERIESEMQAYALDDGRPLRSYAFPGGGLCNDMAVAPDGTVFVTDMSGGRILVLGPQATQLEVWIDDARLEGIDGIVAFESSVYANNFRSGELYAFTHGPGVPDWYVLSASKPLTRPDGMRPLADGGFLLVEGVGVLSRVSIHDRHAHIQVLYEGLEGTTAVTVARGHAWVLDSMFRYRSNPEIDTGPFKAYGVPLPD